jgi:hypothetical protein
MLAVSEQTRSVADTVHLVATVDMPVATVDMPVATVDMPVATVDMLVATEAVATVVVTATVTNRFSIVVHFFVHFLSNNNHACQ